MRASAGRGGLGPTLLLVLLLLTPVAQDGPGADEPDLALAVLQDARALAAQGELQAALDKTGRALAFARAEYGPYDPLIGFILDDLATLNYRLGRLEEARTRAEEALDVIGTARGPGSTGYALIASNLASILGALERPQDALRLYEEALPILERTLGRTHARTAASARNLASVRAATGDDAGAAAAYALAIEGWRELEPDRRTAARLMVERARVLLRLERAADAAEQAQAARAILQRVEPAPAADLAAADLVLADLDLRAFEPLRAKDRIVAALDLLNDAGEADGPEAIRLESRLASLDLLTGDPFAAGHRLRRILEAERRRLGPDDPSLGVLHRRLAEALVEQSDLEGARAELESALRSARERSERARASALLARIALESGHADEAARHLEAAGELGADAVAMLEAAPPGQLAELVGAAPPGLRDRLSNHLEAMKTARSVCRQARALTVEAARHRADQDYAPAENALERAVASSEPAVCPGDTALEAALALADFRLADGKPAAAIGLIRAALARTIPAVPPRQLLERTLDLLAATMAGGSDDAGLGLMLEIAQLIGSDEERATRRALLTAAIESGRPGADRLLERRRLFESLLARTRLLHGRDGVLEAESTTADDGQSFRRLAIDRDNLAEADHALRQGFPQLAPLLPLPLALAQIQAALGPDEALLVQVTGERASHLHMVRSSGVRYAQTSMNRADLEAWVDQARAGIGATGEAFDSFALHALHVGLMSPFADMLDGIDHLFVRPDGAAGRIPFGALVAQPAEPVRPGGDYASLDFLIGRVAISMVEDLAILVHGRDPSAAAGAFAGFAAPTSAVEPAPEPARAGRLQALAGALDADDPLLDLQAARSGVLALDLRHYRALAFALPVVRDPLGLPALAFSSGSPEAVSRLSIQDLAGLDLDADLVILLGEKDARTENDGAWDGLVQALTLAGARAVLFTRAEAGAESLRQVAGPTARAVLAGRAPAKALRDAVLPLIEGQDGRTAHPGFWAPFAVTIGAR